MSSKHFAFGIAWVIVFVRAFLEKGEIPFLAFVPPVIIIVLIYCMTYDSLCDNKNLTQVEIRNKKEWMSVHYGLLATLVVSMILGVYQGWVIA